ncbi:MAG: hypothetical protein ACK2T4_04915 [Candidatus Promineifilaceae bacterium]|jgi:hypothetical protein
MITPAQISDYQTYILRIWKESGKWQFSIESLGSDQRKGFAVIEELFAFLEEAAMPDMLENNSVQKKV